MQAAGFAAIVLLAGTAQPWIAYVGPFVVAGHRVSLALPTLPTGSSSGGGAGRDRVGGRGGQHGAADRAGHRHRRHQRGLRRRTARWHRQRTVTSGFRWALSASAVLSLIGAAVAATHSDAARPRWKDDHMPRLDEDSFTELVAPYRHDSSCTATARPVRSRTPRKHYRTHCCRYGGITTGSRANRRSGPGCTASPPNRVSTISSPDGGSP